MRSVKIYLAGALLNYEEEAPKWRAYVKEKLGHKVIYLDPIEESAIGKNSSDIINQDKQMISMSDIVLVDWAKISAGTSMEIIYAWENDKTIYVIDSGAPISIWVEYHATEIFESVDDAIDRIAKGLL